MSVSITYKTTNPGVWTGIGVKLSASQIDTNFNNVAQAIDDLVANPIQPDQITSVSLSGSDMYIHFESTQVIGPIAFPVLSFHWAGEWTPLSLYTELDVTVVTSVGLYLVLQDHTAEATFDEAREILSQPVYFKLFGFSGISGVALADLTDVSATSPANGDFLIFSTGPNKWIAGQIPSAYVSNSMLGNMAAHRFKGNNTGSSGPPLDLTATQITQELDVFVDGGAGTGTKGLVPAPAAGDTTAGKVLLPAGWGHPALARDSDVTITSPTNGQVLTYQTSSGKWINQSITVTISGLPDFDVVSPADGQVFVYRTSDSQWHNEYFDLLDLHDTDITSLADGDALLWDGTASKWINGPVTGGGGSSTLAGDTDVNISSPANGQFLRYQTSDNKWHNSALTFTLSGFGFTDVNIVSPANGEILTYNSVSGKWENEAGSAGVAVINDLTDVTITSPADQAPLIWDNGTSQWIDGDPASLVPTIADNRISANISGGTARPVGKTISQVLDLLSATNSAVPYRSGGTWGNLLFNLTSLADNDVLIYDNGSGEWRNHRQHYDIASFVPGVLTASQDMLLHRFSKGVTFPANFGAYLGRTTAASSLVAATGSTTIKVQKAASATPTTFSDVGTIVFAAAALVATFTTSGGTTLAFAQGDVLRLIGPASADATLASVCATLVGYET